jgi:hypothetical protein
MLSVCLLLLVINVCFCGQFRNNIDHVDIRKLVARAKLILQDNFVEGNAFHLPHTVPSKTLYPHSWFWDACFIAIGVSRFNITRAMIEVDAVLAGQWLNGMVNDREQYTSSIFNLFNQFLLIDSSYCF